MIRDAQTRRELAGLSQDFTVEALATGKTQSQMQDALQRGGRLRQRRSPLQPLLVIWLQISMAIFRRDSIPAVLARLLTGLRTLIPKLPLQPVTDGALAHARERLGVRPVREFFNAQAAEVQPAPSFHGMRVWIFDGTSLTMPDTQANRAVFKRPKVSRGQAAFPQLKLVGLQDACSRRFRDVTFGLWDAPERPAAVPLLRHLSEGDLLLLDRGFYAVWFFEQIQRRKAHFVARIPDFVKLRPVEATRKRDGDYLAWIQARVALPVGQVRKPPIGRPAQTRTVRILVRVIEYHIPGFRRVRLATDLLDRQQICAVELARLYHLRWDVEIGFDEVKTHQTSHAGGTPRTTFRSKRPRRVMQEAYALFAAYNLVRATMEEAAHRHRLRPDHIGFVDSLRAITHMLPRMRGARAAELPSLHRQMLADIADCRLDRPRRPRRYPRVVKQKMSNFKLKRSRHRQQRFPQGVPIKIGDSHHRLFPVPA